MGGRRKQVKRLQVRNVRLTPAEDRFLINLAKESADTVSHLLRELVQREKKVRENRRARWGKKARKYLTPRLREALKIVLDEAKWKERIAVLLDGDEYEVGVLEAYLNGLFDDILPGELTNYGKPTPTHVDEQTPLPPLPEVIPPPT
jgi:hypothetical protein